MILNGSVSLSVCLSRGFTVADKTTMMARINVYVTFYALRESRATAQLWQPSIISQLIIMVMLHYVYAAVKRGRKTRLGATKPPILLHFIGAISEENTRTSSAGRF